MSKGFRHRLAGVMAGVGCLLVVAALVVATVRVQADGADTGTEVDAGPYTLERSAVIRLAGPGGELYPLMVAWPRGEAPAGGWPVLYVLDGQDNFPIFALTARRLARAGVRTGIAPGLVVGIGAGPLPRRVFDYTPPVPGYRIAEGMPASGLAIGGGEVFLDFVEQQVVPAVHRRWPVDAARETLVGHSFGGLLAVHTFLKRPALFDHLVAVSPSFWFGDGLLAREAATAPDAPRGSLLVVTGGAERGNAGQSAAVFHATLLAALPDARLRTVNLEGQSHGSTMMAALGDALAVAFSMGN
ncbi:MAG: alpha/beta hydrolase [Parahaliea sp.]